MNGPAHNALSYAEGQTDRTMMRTRVRHYRRRVVRTAGLYPRLLAALFVIAAPACSKESIEPAATRYSDDAPRVCRALAGTAGRHNDERTAGGTPYRVRTPANYDPAIAHPVLLVYPGAGQSGAASERHTGLTPAATAAGYIVAFADHRRLSLAVLDDLATIPAALAKKWCVDPARVYVTGHSDGGTAAAAMAFRDDDGFVPAAIIPSAAGLKAEDLAAYRCPSPLPVLIFHSADDRLFAGFGRSAAQWWATCNSCAATTHTTRDSCVAFDECPAAAPVHYCEGDGGHRRWPQRNAALLQFLRDVERDESNR